MPVRKFTVEGKGVFIQTKQKEVIEYIEIAYNDKKEYALYS